MSLKYVLGCIKLSNGKGALRLKIYNRLASVSNLLRNSLGMRSGFRIQNACSLSTYIFFNRLLECYVAYFTEKSAKECALLGIVKEKEHSPTFIVNELFLLAREFRVLRRFHNHNTTVFCVLQRFLQRSFISTFAQKITATSPALFSS